MSVTTRPADFFVAGGALRPSAPSYVKRPADETLFNLALAGEFCYVLTARQMGKSSLMARTASRLRAGGSQTVIIDLTAIGRQTTVDQWFLGLLTELKTALNLTVDLEAWGRQHAFLGIVHRFTKFLHDIILREIEGPVVIFIDEIDMTLNLPFADDFFAAIRSIYNARAHDPAYQRLTFILFGVAAPTDLIKDPDHTPFNIGYSIDLHEFSRADAQVLQQGLEAVHPRQGKLILDRIFYWTNGHPYLTQRLCSMVVDKTGYGNWDDKRVDHLVAQSFLSEAARLETNLRFVQDRIDNSPRKPQLLRLYKQVYRGRTVPVDEQSSLQNRLRLFGLVGAENRTLKVRNEIYCRMFDLDWINARIPVNWTRRYIIITTVILIAILGYFFWPPPPPVTLIIASSRTKEEWLNQAVTHFNATGTKTAAGRPIIIEVSHVLSGGSRNSILAGFLQPVVWSPGDRSWIGEINTIWRQRYNDPLISQACQPTVYAPIGFAMWRPMAEALGWPEAPIGWETVVDLAADPLGWGRYGHPEWGQFRFGHTHPGYSNSGLLSRIAFVYGLVGQDKPLTANDVHRPEVEEAMSALEQVTVKYGSQSAHLFELMVQRGPNVLHAIAASEETTLRFNLQQGADLRSRSATFFGPQGTNSPLDFIFPSASPIWAHHPSCTL